MVTREGEIPFKTPLRSSFASSRLCKDMTEGRRKAVLRCFEPLLDVPPALSTVAELQCAARQTGSAQLPQRLIDRLRADKESAFDVGYVTV